MYRWSNRMVCALLSLLLLAAAPLAALAESSLDSMEKENSENTEQSIADNPDLSDAEKQQWQQWADEEAADGTETSDDEEDAALVDALQDAIGDADASAQNADDLELNAALPGNVVNILLLGVDNRSIALKSGLSDAVIICSINTDNGSVKLTSITRDTEVIVPGYKSTKRINCAFKYGSKDGDLDAGGKLAMKTVNRNFRMNIQRYVVVNIHGLASIIDELGGVDLDMTSQEASRINFELRKEPMDKVTRAKVQALDGVQHLDGMQAVTFARIRGIDNDFMRTERQRKLLETLLEKVMEGMDMNKLVSLIETALPFGKTNLTAADIIMLGKPVLEGQAMSNLSSGASVLEQFRIPMDGTFKYKDVSGATLTAFRSDERKEDNIVAMQEFIYGQSYDQK